MEVEKKEWLTWDEIKKRYPEEWVVLGDCTLSETTCLLGAVVYYHLKDKREARRLSTLVPSIHGARWTGEHFGFYSHLGTENEKKRTPEDR